MEHRNALDNFMQHLEEKGRSRSTMIAYKKDIEQFFDHYAGKAETVKDFETSHVQLYIEKLIEEKEFTLKTISRKINSYKSFFKFLHGQNVIENDIAHPISHPIFKAKAPRILSNLEYRALRDSARGNVRLYAMIELLLQTGIRIGELSRLKIEDLKFNKPNPSAKIAEFSSIPERSVPLNQQAVEALTEYTKIRPNPKDDQGYIFTTKTGNQVLVRNVRTMVNNAFRKSGIENATVNDIRNTFIVHQLENGIPLEKVAEIVGHKRLTSTEKYLDLLKDKRKESNNKVVAL